MTKLVFTSLLLLSITATLFAQKAPIKFGKVSEKEVAMKVYEPDSTVDAMVLCEYGVFNPRELDFTYTIRYKVFTKEGLNSLILKIPAENKSSVKGMVFNIEDGKLTESKMNKESIYEERIIGSYSRIRIAPPNVREGSVIDISYRMRGLPYEWNFQKSIPVLWSELIIPYSEYYKFTQRSIGYVPLHVVSNYRWVGKDMPAFIPEPFISSNNNYMTTMFIEVSEIHIPGNSYSTGYHEQFSTSWSDVARYYYDHTYYGVILRESSIFLNDVADEIKASSKDEKEMVYKALDRVQADVKWNKRDRLFPSKSFRDVYVKDKTGSSADMNFLFMKLLEKMEIECYPMLLSTRNEGFINPMFPSRSRFNYTASYVKIDDKFCVIDASDKYYGVDLLRPACLNSAGFVVKREKGEWVAIVPEKMSKKMINCNLNIAEDGVVEGNMMLQYAEYAAATYRKAREDYTTEDEYIEEFEKDHAGIFVTDYQVSNLEQERGSISETFEVEIDGSTSLGADLIQIDPVMIDRLEENPFKLESRIYPVDFAYGRNNMYILTMNIPDGYESEQLPSPIRIVTSDKSCSFQFNATQSGSTLQLMYSMTLKKPVYLQAEYEELRGFYDLIVKKQAEPIILKKVQP